ncbi:hypothetical protein [Thioalkalivibrio sp. ALE23]|uniref:hypothetical protein n=1 Tax=Thioalkalivibrio sp. ALE23 TaxID=1265495 RepID=UPI00037EFBDB|nr:hypothetical protein [Thioalkalivibrio sp. ALE23]
MNDTQDQFDHSDSALTLELTLVAEYDLNGEEPGVLKDRLNQMVTMAVGDGLLTGDTPAEVDEWFHHVREVESSSSSVGVLVSADALQKVLRLAEHGLDSRSEYLGSAYGENDYGKDEIEAALKELDQEGESLNLLSGIVSAALERTDADLDDAVEKAYTVVFQLPDFLLGCGGGDTCVWVSHTHGRFWSDAVRNAAYAACDAIDGIEDKDDLAVLLAFEGHHQDRIEANSTLHATAPEDGSGYWDEDPDFTVEDWKYEVGNDDTRESYWSWVAKQREAAREDAAI